MSDLEQKYEDARLEIGILRNDLRTERATVQRLTEERDAALRGEEVANRLLDDYRASLAAKDEEIAQLKKVLNER